MIVSIEVSDKEVKVLKIKLSNNKLIDPTKIEMRILDAVKKRNGL